MSRQYFKMRFKTYTSLIDSKEFNVWMDNIDIIRTIRDTYDFVWVDLITTSGIINLFEKDAGEVVHNITKEQKDMIQAVNKDLKANLLRKETNIQKLRDEDETNSAGLGKTHYMILEAVQEATKNGTGITRGELYKKFPEKRESSISGRTSELKNQHRLIWENGSRWDDETKRDVEVLWTNIYKQPQRRD